MHYVEDMLKDKLPFKLYHDQLFTVTAYDENDIKYEIKTFAFNKNVVRNLRKLEEEMLKRDLIKTVKVGNSNLVVVNAEDVVTCMTSMVESGNLFYDDWDKEIGITS
jgi:hypothetical protein